MPVPLSAKSWFGEERALKDQMRGPDALLTEVKGKTILDLGCAEGLISLELMEKGGATLVHGMEAVLSRVTEARNRFCGTSAQFWCGDVEQFNQQQGVLPAYDVVLALSIAHKLRDPERFLRLAAGRSREFIAIRLPNPVIHDRRSNFRKVDVPALMRACGFATWRDGRHHLNEWTGIYKRAEPRA